MIKIIISPSQQTGIEENLVRPIAELLYNKLKSDNLVESILTPDYANMTDNAALWNVIQFCNNSGADYILDIHSDAGGYAKGCSGLYVSESGKNFITPITQAIMDLTPWNDVGIRRRTDLGILNQTTAIAGLIELSFHDSPDEYKWMQENGELIAETLKNGIYKALNIQPVIDWEKKYKELQNYFYSYRGSIINVTNKFI